MEIVIYSRDFIWSIGVADHIIDSHLGVGFRKNSSLFIVAGSAEPSDDEQSALGIYYYLWKNNQMKLLHW